MQEQQDFQKRLKDFMPIVPVPTAGEAIQQAVSGNQDRFEKALTLLTDMALEGHKIIATRHGDMDILWFMCGLTVEQAHHLESDESKLAKFRHLVRISEASNNPNSVSSYNEMANILSGLKDPLNRSELWGQLKADKSEVGLLRLASVTRNLRDVSGLSNEENSGRFSKQEKEKCIDEAMTIFADILENETSDENIKAAAYKGIKLFASQLTLKALKVLFELNTPESYKDAKGILINEAFERSHRHSPNIPKEAAAIVYDYLNNPQAKRALIDIALENYDYGRKIYQELKDRVGGQVTQDEFEAFDTEYTTTYKGMLVGTLKELRNGGDPYDVMRRVTNYCYLDVETSLNILAICPVSDTQRPTENDVVSLIKNIAKKFPEFKDFAFDTLVTRGTYPSLYAAIDDLILDAKERGDNPQPDDLQDRKKSILEKIGQIDDETLKRQSIVDLYLSMALVPQIVDDEITKAVISTLIAQGEYVLIEKMVAKSQHVHSHVMPGYHEATGTPIQFYGSVDRVYYDGRSVPQYADYALQTLIDASVKKGRGLQAIRNIANAGNEEMGTKALEYFIAVNSRDSLDQIRLLRNADSVSYYSKLPPEKAVPALEMAFTQNPFGSMKALLDMRGAAINQGVNDLAVYDAAILVGLTKLADKHRLRKEIEAGNQTTLDFLFTNVAKAGLPDLRNAFKFALQVHNYKRDLASSERQLETALQSCGLK
jgi:hypothetical protein